ncbi:hypothetical protein [Rhizobium laguerreae]|uniref:hypothetical protein n=1 Tax=Rhizobium laguerreae TaxID=1076926 RepID=UPI001C90487D|nr:hypothetical protein [Rhizobium laguerreae]MBY3386416.1 hypothetical protein [Rhizobium laguerreae]MBY3400499.1 hypothetical protein [Rhizobium laguerreae]MBY3407437.1 hypothetical protein [Rhizobium laguerreae]
MNKTAVIIAGIVATLSSCQTPATTVPQPGSKVETEAHKCVQEIWKRKEKKKTTGEISWNTHVKPGTTDVVGLSYIEVSSDGSRPGEAWRSCMKARGVDIATLDLGDRELAPGRLPDIN